MFRSLNQPGAEHNSNDELLSAHLIRCFTIQNMAASPSSDEISEFDKRDYFRNEFASGSDL
jgi:hypothetical protein